MNHVAEIHDPGDLVGRIQGDKEIVPVGIVVDDLGTQLCETRHHLRNEIVEHALDPPAARLVGNVRGKGAKARHLSQIPQ